MNSDAIVLHERDNVGTALRNLDEGEMVTADCGKLSVSVRLVEPIAFGHKFALADLPEGADVVKYGETIGSASARIASGRHVHVHNVLSRRGRRKEEA